METVFRTTEGFTTPWVNWESTSPAGMAGDADGVNDCVMRDQINGQWKDANCSTALNFYCEGL